MPERMPWWVRAGLHVPYVDRYAQQWMWSHGGFLVLPADHPFHERYGPGEYESLTGITKAEYERRCLAAAREAIAREAERFPDAEVDLERAGDDTCLVMRFGLADRPGRRFGTRVPLWPSPHPDDYEGDPEWSDMLPALLAASLDSAQQLAADPDADGVTWV
jgi:hypothetical protein